MEHERDVKIRRMRAGDDVSFMLLDSFLSFELQFISASFYLSLIPLLLGWPRKA